MESFINLQKSYQCPSSKSTLLRAFLGETTKTQGTVSISESRIAYCDQTPWILNGSIRDNILMGADYDEPWYNNVVQSCALDTDFSLLADGDSTVVGSKGMKLSGGQKQRIVRLPCLLFPLLTLTLSRQSLERCTLTVRLCFATMY
jgi:ABC-type transport system involved in cytochrome bd biosynthesis fused ATPase/permease subunit